MTTDHFGYRASCLLVLSSTLCARGALAESAGDARDLVPAFAFAVDDTAVLRDVAQGTETTFSRDQIAARREIGSLMPTGLIDQLSRKDQQDLFKYLSTLGKPTK